MCKQKSSSIVQHIPTTYVELKSKFISSSMVPRYGTSPPQFQKLGGNNVGKCKNCFFSIMVIFYFISKLKVNSDQPSKKLYNQNSYYVSSTTSTPIQLQGISSSRVSFFCVSFGCGFQDRNKKCATNHNQPLSAGTVGINHQLGWH